MFPQWHFPRINIFVSFTKPVAEWIRAKHHGTMLGVLYQTFSSSTCDQHPSERRLQVLHMDLRTGVQCRLWRRRSSLPSAGVLPSFFSSRQMPTSPARITTTSGAGSEALSNPRAPV